MTLLGDVHGGSHDVELTGLQPDEGRFPLNDDGLVLQADPLGDFLPKGDLASRPRRISRSINVFLAFDVAGQF